MKTDITVKKSDALEFDNYEPPITNINQPSDLTETIKELNKDDLNPAINMSEIDFKARLKYVEMPFLIAFDGLVAFNMLPAKCLLLTRKKSRLSVSLDGMGRKEIVEIAKGYTGEPEMERPKSFGEKFKGALGFKK